MASPNFFGIQKTQGPEQPAPGPGPDPGSKGGGTRVETHRPPRMMHCMVYGESLFVMFLFFFVFLVLVAVSPVEEQCHSPTDTPPRSIMRDGVYHLSRLFFPFLSVRIRTHLL